VKGTPKKSGPPFLFKGQTMLILVRYDKSPTGWATLREIVQPRAGRAIARQIRIEQFKTRTLQKAKGRGTRPGPRCSPQRAWYAITAVGLLTALLLVIYDRVVKPGATQESPKRR
jgi:hypothetical protein